MSEDKIEILNISEASVIETIDVTSREELSRVIDRAEKTQLEWS
jgi:hypothetical protein